MARRGELRDPDERGCNDPARPLSPRPHPSAKDGWLDAGSSARQGRWTPRLLRPTNAPTSSSPTQTALARSALALLLLLPAARRRPSLEPSASEPRPFRTGPAALVPRLLFLERTACFRTGRSCTSALASAEVAPSSSPLLSSRLTDDDARSAGRSRLSTFLALDQTASCGAFDNVGRAAAQRRRQRLPSGSRLVSRRSSAAAAWSASGRLSRTRKPACSYVGLYLLNRVCVFLC